MQHWARLVIDTVGSRASELHDERMGVAEAAAVPLSLDRVLDLAQANIHVAVVASLIASTGAMAAILAPNIPIDADGARIWQTASVQAPTPAWSKTSLSGGGSLAYFRPIHRDLGNSSAKPQVVQARFDPDEGAPLQPLTVADPVALEIAVGPARHAILYQLPLRLGALDPNLESIAIVLSGLPTGVRPLAGEMMAAGTWLLRPSELDGLQLEAVEPVPAFDLRVDGIGQDRNSVVQLTVRVAAPVESAAPATAPPRTVAARSSTMPAAEVPKAVKPVRPPLAPVVAKTAVPSDTQARAKKADSSRETRSARKEAQPPIDQKTAHVAFKPVDIRRAPNGAATPKAPTPAKAIVAAPPRAPMSPPPSAVGALNRLPAGAAPPAGLFGATKSLITPVPQWAPFKTEDSQ